MAAPRNKNSLISILLFALLGAVLFFGLFMLHSSLINKTIKKHEADFNNQQYLETGLAASALGEAVDGYLSTSGLLAEYSFPEYLRGYRSRQSIKNLLKLEFAIRGSNSLYAFFLFPGHPDIMGVPTSSADITALDLAKKWSIEFWDDPGLKAGHLVVPPIYARPRAQFIGFLLPVMVDDKREGVLIAVFNLNPLIKKYIAPMRSGKYGAGYLLSGNGTVVYDHEEEIIGRNVFDGMHAPHPSLLAVDKRLVSEDSGKGEYSFTIKRKDRVSRKLIAWNSLRIGSRKLVICLSAPDLEIDSALRETRLLQNLTTGLTILLMAGFGYFIFRRETARRVKANEERLEAALAGNRDGVWDWNIKTGVSFHSDRWKEMLGYSPSDPIDSDEHWRKNLHPDDEQFVMALLDRHLKGDTPFFESEYRIKCKDGTWKWVLSRGKVVERASDGSPIRIIGTHTDISARKSAEMEVKKLSQAVESSPSPIIITDPEGMIQYVNRSFTRVCGYSEEEVLGKSPGILKSDKQDREAYGEMWKALNNGQSWSGELINTSKSGDDIWLRVSISPIFDNRGNTAGYVGTQEDITALKHKECELARLATTDELTGIFNRRRFLEAAHQEYRRSLRHPASLAIVIFDIDHFKVVNDTHGHTAGDAVLKGLADTVSAAIREIDVFGRIGGEEFALVLPQTGLQRAAAISERIRRAIETAVYRSGNLSIEITASFGVSGFEEAAPLEVDQLLKEADKALYQAKQTGRNKVVSFTEMDECTDGRCNLFNENNDPA